ncbi:MAG: hypothetical protein WKG07_21025 [Hymenobacter sp.]
MRFRHLPVNLRYLTGVVALEVISEIALFVLHYYHRPNLFIGPIFVAGELWLFSLVYDKTLRYPEFFAGAAVAGGGFRSLLRLR